MPRRLLWDIFCQVIDNHGDLGVCWRLASQLAAAEQRVRLWVDDASALAWMAPGATQGLKAGISVMPWQPASEPKTLQSLPPAEVWIEAFGCEIPEAFVAHRVAQSLAAQTRPPAWFNLEYLSAEASVTRLHGLPSPVMSGPAKGWTKRFFYPGFTPGTGGLLREADLLARQQAFDRQAWRDIHAPGLSPGSLLISLFCYEPAALPQLLMQTAQAAGWGPAHLLVAPGRPLAAVQRALAHWPDAAPKPSWLPLPYTDQAGFDNMLWASNLNFVRGEDSLVRALWAGQPFVWHIYPQDDQAHHAKLEAFMDWLQAPESLRRYHRVWNGLDAGPLPPLDANTLAAWGDCAQAARHALLQQSDLLTNLMIYSIAQPAG